MASELQLLTHSRLEAFRTCPRLHQFTYTRGFRPVRVASPLRFGDAGHKCLQGYYDARRSGLGEEGRMAAALSKLPTDWEDPFEFAKLEILIIGYVTFWDLVPMTVLGVEEKFALPLVNPDSGFPSRTFRLAGKLDVRADLEDGRHSIIEHKFTTNNAAPGGAYRERLQMDGQVSQYYLGAEALGKRPDVVIYDVIHKPMLRPRLATPIEARKHKKDGTLYAKHRDRDETIEEYRTRLIGVVSTKPTMFFQQVEVVRLSDEHDEYRWDVWETADAIRRSERTGRAARFANACMRYGSPCAFWPVCTKRASLDDTALYRQKTSAHEELEEDEKEIESEETE